MNRITLISALCAYSLGAFAAQDTAKDPYEEYLRQLDEQQKAATAGWHWYNETETDEDETAETQPEQPQPTNTTPTEQPKQQQTVQITAEWLKENIPKLLNTAVNNPTQENLKNYWMAVRLSKDMASRFTDNTKTFFATHPELSEAKRRPESNYALAQYRPEVAKNKTNVVKSIFERAGIWFFYASTCPYCAQEAPILRSLEELYGVNILAVSLDGKPMPNGIFQDYVVDPTGELARKLAVQKTPTLYLVTNDGQQFHMLAEGIVTMDELLDAIITTAHSYKIISEQEYQSTLEVKQQLVVEHQSGPLEIDAERLKSDPAYLSKILEQKINEFPSYGTQDVSGLTQLGGVNAGQ